MEKEEAEKWENQGKQWRRRETYAWERLRRWEFRILMRNWPMVATTIFQHSRKYSLSNEYIIYRHLYILIIIQKSYYSDRFKQ